MQVLTPAVDKIGALKARLGESAVWHAPDNAVLWVDINAQQVLRTHIGTGRTQSWAFPEQTGFVQPAADGTWLVGQHGMIARLTPETGQSAVFATLEPASLGNRTNDAGCDRAGRLWVGTMKRPPAELAPVGTLYRLDANAAVTVVDEGLYIPNGIAFSPRGERAYWADTYKDRRMIWQAACDAGSGRIGPKTPFVQLAEADGRPDGATVDADGCYWVAAVWGWQLLRYTPRGELDLVVRLPVQRPSKVVFGGADLKTMFITTISEGLEPDAAATQPLAGHLLAIDLGIQGMPSTLVELA